MTGGAQNCELNHLATYAESPQPWNNIFYTQQSTNVSGMSVLFAPIRLVWAWVQYWRAPSDARAWACTCAACVLSV